jgi:hypothetical protein
VLPADSSGLKQYDHTIINHQGQDTVIRYNLIYSDLIKQNNLAIPVDIFQLRLHYLYNGGVNSIGSEESLSPLLLSSSVEYSFSDNKKELLSYLNNMYLQSRPTKLQEILGTIDFSGAVLLAGYHIWKYYIKK